MSESEQTFIRYTIGAGGRAVILELVQPLNGTPILFDETQAIVQIAGARLSDLQHQPTAT